MLPPHPLCWGPTRPFSLFAKTSLRQSDLNHVLNILGMARKISAWTSLAVLQIEKLEFNSRPGETAWLHVLLSNARDDLIKPPSSR